MVLRYVFQNLSTIIGSIVPPLYKIRRRFSQWQTDGKVVDRDLHNPWLQLYPLNVQKF